MYMGVFVISESMLFLNRSYDDVCVCAWRGRVKMSNRVTERD